MARDDDSAMELFLGLIFVLAVVLLVSFLIADAPPPGALEPMYAD